MPSIEHFEIPVDDMERAKRFYRELFGWTYEQWPDFEYVMVRATKNDGTPGLGGGMMKRQHPQQGITNYVVVPSVDEYLAKAETLGGKVRVPRQEIPGAGVFAVLQDSEGNVFALWQSRRQG